MRKFLAVSRDPVVLPLVGDAATVLESITGAPAPTLDTIPVNSLKPHDAVRRPRREPREAIAAVKRNTCY